jgi:hypothetical protein
MPHSLLRFDSSPLSLYSKWDDGSDLVRNFAIRERFCLQFRAEIFNIFNQADFGLPINSCSQVIWWKTDEAVTNGRGCHVRLPGGVNPDGISPGGDGCPARARSVNRYCSGCHNEKLKSGGLALTTLDTAYPDHDAQEWVVVKLRGGMLPPPGAPRRSL